MSNTKIWLWLADAVGSGFRKSRELLAAYPDPVLLYDAVRHGWELPGCLSARAVKKLNDTTLEFYEQRITFCQNAGIAILTPESEDYPERFRALPDAPLVLYATGHTGVLNGRRYVGMVGTRRATPYGRQACSDFSRDLARQGVVIVSGLAEGLDGVGHTAAVEAGTPTVAFLGTAIDKTYPAMHRTLRRQIEAGGGCVLSEYAPGYDGRTGATFLARNRLIAGLSEALCVAEAREKSGTLNTVGHAEGYGRPVFAVPGSIYSAESRGTNELLRTGRARMLCSAKDVLDAIGFDFAALVCAPAPVSTDGMSEDQKAVYSALGAEPRNTDELCRLTGLPVQRVLVATLELEWAEKILVHPGRRYSLK